MDRERLDSLRTRWDAIPGHAAARLKGNGGRMTATNGAVKDALGYLESHFDDFKRQLVELSKIPSISAAGFPPEPVKRSAEATARVMREAGVENVQLLEIPGVHPYVYGAWPKTTGAPTLLL